MKQGEIQDSFIHIDATYKLIDLRFPIIQISTETIKHNYRPICFFISEGETKDKLIKMLTSFSTFLKNQFAYEFKPKYIMTDNSDALIGACKDTFGKEYIHMTCLFHVMKRMKEHLRSKDMKDFETKVFYGLKILKNSYNSRFFHKSWELIKDYWIEKKVPNTFINAFEKEYINKDFVWFYGAAFAGKSRTNNSLESGNNILKIFLKENCITSKNFL